MRKELTFNGNLTARATETRRGGKSKEPIDRGATEIQSHQARLLQKVIRKDCADSYQQLVKFLGEEARKLIEFNSWNLENPHQVAVIILDRYITEDVYTDAECAKMIGVSKWDYSRKWKLNLAGLDAMAKRWYVEVVGR